jgi:hypothetical protein
MILVVDKLGEMLNSTSQPRDENAMLSVHLKNFDTDRHDLPSVRRSILVTDERKAERQSKRQVLKRVFFNIPTKGQVLWKITPFTPNNIIIQRWRTFMLFPLGYEVWAFPYRLALGIPSISSQMAITSMDFTFDMFFLMDMIVTLSTTIPNPPGGETPIKTFADIARHFFQKKFVYEVLPSFPFWVATFMATNHLQDPKKCGKVAPSGLSLNWSCVMSNLDWPIYVWWITSAIRAFPRLLRMITDFKAMESNLV